jgi:hypothetical protein
MVKLNSNGAYPIYQRKYQDTKQSLLTDSIRHADKLE